MMNFTFTFTSLLPYNPFFSAPPTFLPTSPPPVRPTLPESSSSNWSDARRRLPPRPPRRFASHLSEQAMTSNLGKRGWEPSPPTSPAAAQAGEGYTASGDFDTPSKYLAAAADSQITPADEDEDRPEPPAKRRRLGETIISTALSAALIGTAVGLTAYKLWRDRGRLPDAPSIEYRPATPSPEPAPPPYTPQDEPWVITPSPKASMRAYSASPSKIPRQRRPASKSISTSRVRAKAKPLLSTPLRSSARVHSQQNSPISNASPAPSASRLPLAEAEPPVDSDVEDHMDWMSDRLKNLIAQGQAALGKQVVVADDTVPISEDANIGLEDDGDGGWGDDDEGDNNKSHLLFNPPSHYSRGMPNSISAPARLHSRASVSSSSFMPSTSLPFGVPAAHTVPLVEPVYHDAHTYASPSKAHFSYPSHSATPNPIHPRLNSPFASPITVRSSHHQTPIHMAPAATYDDAGGSPDLRARMESIRRAKLGL